jgi:hypothetical protein
MIPSNEITNGSLQSHLQNDSENDSQLNIIPTTISVETNNHRQCPACLEELPNEVFVQYRRCIHALCRDCHTHWSAISNRCPVCRTLVDDEDVLINASLERINTSLNNALQELERLRLMEPNRIFRSLDTENVNANSDNQQPDANRQNLRQQYINSRRYIQQLLNITVNMGLMRFFSFPTSIFRDPTLQRNNNPINPINIPTNMESTPSIPAIHSLDPLGINPFLSTLTNNGINPLGLASFSTVTNDGNDELTQSNMILSFSGNSSLATNNSSPTSFFRNPLHFDENMFPEGSFLSNVSNFLSRLSNSRSSSNPNDINEN